MPKQKFKRNKNENGFSSTLKGTVNEVKNNSSFAFKTSKKALKDLPDLPWKKLPKEGYLLLIIGLLIMIGFFFLGIYLY